MKRITRKRLLLFVAATIVLLGIWSFFDQDIDTSGPPVGDSIPLHMTRHFEGVEMTFDAVTRNSESGEIKLTGKLKGRVLPITQKFLNVTAWIKPNSQIFSRGEGINSHHSTDPPDTDTFNITLFDPPTSPDQLFWSFTPVTADFEQSGSTFYLTTPNPGKSSVFKGFVVGPTTISNGALNMTLKSFKIDIRKDPSPPLPRFDIKAIRAWYTSLWDVQSIISTTSSELSLTGSPADWVILHGPVEPNFGKGAPYSPDDGVDWNASGRFTWTRSGRKMGHSRSLPGHFISGLFHHQS